MKSRRKNKKAKPSDLRKKEVSQNSSKPDYYSPVKDFKPKLKPKTENQANLIRTIAENTVTVAMGPPGSGKTKLSVAYGVEKLLMGDYKRLIITRPVVEVGSSMGFLPGSFSEKLDPYLQPIYYELLQYVSKQQLQTLINNGINHRGAEEVVIAPLAYMRGMNYHDAYMILDEAQNCSYQEIKLFITRVGFNSKAILVGDDKQSDLPSGKSGLIYWHEKLQDIESVGTYKLQNTDIIRNPVISRILSKIGE